MLLVLGSKVLGSQNFAAKISFGLLYWSLPLYQKHWFNIASEDWTKSLLLLVPNSWIYIGLNLVRNSCQEPEQLEGLIAQVPA